MSEIRTIFIAVSDHSVQKRLSSSANVSFASIFLLVLKSVMCFQMRQGTLRETRSPNRRGRVCSLSITAVVPSNRPKFMLSSVMNSVQRSSLNRPSALCAKSLSGKQPTDIFLNCHISHFFMIMSHFTCFFSTTGVLTSRVISADVSVGLLSCEVVNGQVWYHQTTSICLILSSLCLSECNAAIHKKCIDKVIAKCTGSAINSKETMVSICFTFVLRLTDSRKMLYDSFFPAESEKFRCHNSNTVLEV